MNANHRLPRSNSGFTLTELAVVLVIVALLLGGLLAPLSAQIDVRNTSDTRRALGEIREALLGFAAANGRLPCPAPASTASGANGAGIDPLVGTTLVACPSESGVLPWATLGVAETDAWGHRYTYRVSAAFAQALPSGSKAAFQLSTQGTLDVYSAATGGAVVATGVPAVVVSHGANGFGAFTSDGVQLWVGDSNDEAENQLTGGGSAMANTTFVSRTRTPRFDDEVAWISPGVLFNRMITAGKLP
ncbi:prepilin-type N-terminal cleavage/methylation domain-containing protein [Accumulibacter sp.]|uniref:prepilin-type N-terminal cleavage/methylation domain-containing protein n=1 Tax=Accumulibacter sp. TaxID=2053492 RepID=UPI0025D28275|nr:prepilin-type N-terminal cleavage/methylation domain-containing protein [Accumulibacter sp.]MCM8625862.1 prepilin-type N-terminal cleavage/methylation domain-containing protein [Accumulibacter sp.]